MSDGSQLQKTWYKALNDAEAYFKHLFTSPSSDWKCMSNSSKDASSSSSSKGKGKARVSSVPELADVIVHRAYSKAGEEVYRIVLDVPTPSEDMVSLEPWKTVLTTPELRTEWDPAVDDTRLLEIFDHTTRMVRSERWARPERLKARLCAKQLAIQTLRGMVGGFENFTEVERTLFAASER
ncbi:uncharacterized protein LACBIDRAFT_305072 [Laccaria bicolor S238N-H82]|uniref:Predicted protein n=1 Tax=Laccaria bicolor (strain S238N-H82 / ATCC MYA-4686) TaxID=486041 RepID=B0CTD2_LACBS|nr:uncharacterized protein LACBIDRAFT_305072 [Laccaria bicolor S238N-H82]EDR13897.1 predicted protein [Laccaria bicolor S238N-H82]|eukprot:XP_001874456.1 predicted protein [Laccaria bicolor S238N-H82]